MCGRAWRPAQPDLEAGAAAYRFVLRGTACVLNLSPAASLVCCHSPPPVPAPHQAEAEDAEYPDEVDTPQDVAARLRFAKYRCVCACAWACRCLMEAPAHMDVSSSGATACHIHPTSTTPSDSTHPCHNLKQPNTTTTRGLKSFRSSPWDAREGLPAEYGRVFAFENFKRTAKRAREAAVSSCRCS